MNSLSSDVLRQVQQESEIMKNQLDEARRTVSILYNERTKVRNRIQELALQQNVTSAEIEHSDPEIIQILDYTMQQRKQQLPKMYEAIEDIFPERYGYISLEKGEQIKITKMLTNTLWEGERLGSSGYVESTYLREVKPYAWLLERIQSKLRITSADFSNMNLTREDLQVIVPLIIRNQNVKRVNFSNNEMIRDEDIDMIVQLLDTNRLVELNLSGTSITRIDRLLEAAGSEMVSLKLPHQSSKKECHQFVIHF
jgi:hypothetical protein